jgi:hypothetical protein
MWSRVELRVEGLGLGLSGVGYGVGVEGQGRLLPVQRNSDERLASSCFR